MTTVGEARRHAGTAAAVPVALGLALLLATAAPAAADVAPGRLLVRLAPAATAAAAADRASLGRTGLAELDAALADVGAVRLRPALRFAPDRDDDHARRMRRTFVVEYTGGRPPAAAAARLAGVAAVERAEPAGVPRLAVAPDDSLYPDQWAHANTGQAVAYTGGTVGTPDCDTDTDLAWDLVTDASGVLIAVIDTGIDRTHPEFGRRVAAGYDFAYDDDDPADDNGHGTACAGIAAAAGNNGLGVAGAAWNARIMPLKVFNAVEFSSPAWVADAVVWAADHGADILSMSLSLSFDNELLADAVAYAHDAGCAIFCATGNTDGEFVVYPAGYTADTIAVGALSPCNERKSATSCDGETWWGSNYGIVSLLTPGVRIHTTDIRGEDGRGPDDYVSDFNGTSAATPLAAGIGALVLARNPALTPDQLKDVLVHASQDMGPVGIDLETGYGRLNAHLAVLSAFTAPVYVNAGYDGDEWGTLHRPYDTMAEGLLAADPGDTVVVFPGSYAVQRIDLPVTIIAKDGTAVLAP